MEIPKKCRTSCGFQLCMRQQCSHTAQYGIDSRYQGLLSLNILWVAAQMSKISFLVPFGFDHLEIQCFFIRILCSLQDAWEGSLPQKGWSWPCDGKSGQITLFIIQNLVKSSFLLVNNHLQHIKTSRKALDISSVASATLKLFMRAHCFWWSRNQINQTKSVLFWKMWVLSQLTITGLFQWRVATTLEVSGM